MQMITADISNLETEVEVKRVTMIFILQSLLSLPLCTNISWLFIANFSSLASLYGMFFSINRECPRCEFDESTRNDGLPAILIVQTSSRWTATL